MNLLEHIFMCYTSKPGSKCTQIKVVYGVQILIQFSMIIPFSVPCNPVRQYVACLVLQSRL